MSMQNLILFSLIVGVGAAGVVWFSWELLENMAAAVKAAFQRRKARADAAAQKKLEALEMEVQREEAAEKPAKAKAR